ncbi:hypothetical protein ACO2RV_08025 [Ancylobacter sp. VNQ12]
MGDLRYGRDPAAAVFMTINMKKVEPPIGDPHGGLLRKVESLNGFDQ